MDGLKQTPCLVYKSEKKRATYLYVKTGTQLETLPEGLRCLLGKLTPFLNLKLSQSSTLAQADVTSVIKELNQTGYFLQLPPGDEMLH